MPRRALVVVTWDDAWHVVDYEPGPDDRRYAVRTVGWIVSDTPAAIIVAAELLPDGRARGVTRIPRACVVSVRTLS